MFWANIQIELFIEKSVRYGASQRDKLLFDNFLSSVGERYYNGTELFGLFIFVVAVRQ